MRGSDDELLHRYGRQGDSDAFAELVRRHLPTVLAAAGRMTSDAALADDVAQMVFSRLAARWNRVPHRVVLGAWLYSDTRLVALQLLRSERRRRIREEAATMELHKMEVHDPDWDSIRPLLDESMSHLGPSERDVVILRFFEQLSLREISERLGSGEDAVRMRVARAIEKLRDILRRRGVETTAAALSATLSTHAAPTVGLPAFQGMASLALAGSCAVSIPSTSIGMASLLTMTKTQFLVGAVVLVGLALPYGVQRRANDRQQAEGRALREEVQRLREQHAESEANLQRLLTEVTNNRQRLSELEDLRAENARLKSPPTEPSSAPSNPVGDTAETGIEVAPLSEAEVNAFLALPTGEKGRVLALQRFPPGILSSVPKGDELRAQREYLKLRDLGARVRPDLELLENAPDEFAEFQSSYIEKVTGINEPERLNAIREVIRSTYDEAVRNGLVGPARPEVGVEEWAKRREALDRIATHEVQQLLSLEERNKFDRAFIGVMGIDLGLGDGQWHRIIQPDGSVIFSDPKD